MARPDSPEGCEQLARRLRLSPRCVAVAVIVDDDGRALLETGYDRDKKQHFYRLVGGGVHFGETSAAAVVREIGEEVGHHVEYVWKAGHILFGEGTKETESWVSAQKEEIYAGKVSCVLRELTRKIKQAGATQKGRDKKTKFVKIRAYIETRKENMDSANLRRRDLEIASGIVEGSVNYVIGRRFDQGGMRWIKGRAEALLHLRCIEINGDWDRLFQRVEADVLAEGSVQGKKPRILSNQPQR